MGKILIETSIFLIFLIFAWQFEESVSAYFCLGLLPIFGLCEKDKNGVYDPVFGFFQPIGALCGSILMALILYPISSNYIYLLLVIVTFAIIYWFRRSDFGYFILGYIPFVMGWTALGQFVLYLRPAIKDVNFMGMFCYLLFSIKVFEFLALVTQRIVLGLKSKR